MNAMSIAPAARHHVEANPTGTAARPSPALERHGYSAGSAQPQPGVLRVAVIMTVKNDAEGCAVTLASLEQQTRRADQIIIVDGGSSDRTREVIEEYAQRNRNLRLYVAPGANIACGRNIGIEKARCETIALIDAGCRAEPQWLERLMAPFAADAGTEFVAGFYRVEPQSLLETVVGLVTMRGQLDPVNPATFNPSARSMALKKDLWLRAGGFPQWLRYSEDTLFDMKLRSLGATPRFAGDAIVHWRPRTGLRHIARQFYGYGTGRGHTQIGAGDFAYNLRNLVLTIVAGVAALSYLWALPIFIGAGIYFYWWSFHAKSRRIARAAQRLAAYPMAFLVQWVVMASNLAGYLVGSVQRRRRPREFVEPLRRYMHPVPSAVAPDATAIADHLERSTLS